MLLYLLEKAGYPIKEVVVQWHNRDRSNTKRQQSGLSQYVNESLEMAKEIMRVKQNQVKGLYDEI